MRKGNILSGLVLAVVVVSGLFSAMASAQETSVFTVVLSAKDLKKLGGSGQTVGQQLGSLSAFADGQLCATVDVTAPTSDPVLYLGLDGQPEACSLQWSVVAFQDADGDWLNTWFTLQPGSTFGLKNFEMRDCATVNCPPGPIGDLPTRVPTATPSSDSVDTPTATVVLATPMPAMSTPVPATATPLPPTATPVPETVAPAATSTAVVRSLITPPSTGSGGLLHRR